MKTQRRARAVQDNRESSTTRSAFENLVVCDPLHRRCVQIPPVPGDLADPIWPHGRQHFEPFLSPADHEEEESSLQVIYNVMSATKAVAIVFSSVSGRWRAVTSFSIAIYGWRKSIILLRRRYVGNCFYWMGYHHKFMLVLDTLGMKFSAVDFPPESIEREKTIVDAGEGRLGLLIIGDRVFDIYSLLGQKMELGH